MERGIKGRDTTPLIGYESLTDVGSFGQVMGRVTPADIRRLAATNSTDVYRANEVAIEAATIYLEEAQRTEDEAERKRLTDYATRSLTIATMLSEHTAVVDRMLGTPSAHLVALSADWKERDPAAHRMVINSMTAKTVPAAQPAYEAPRSAANIKKSARKVSVPVALATASAILVAHPVAAAAAEDKPIRDEVAKGPANSTQEMAADAQKTPGSLAVGQVIASGIPLEDSTSKQDGDMRSNGKKEAPVSPDETPAPAVKDQNKVDDAKSSVGQIVAPPKPTQAPTSTKSVADAKNDEAVIRKSERIDEQGVVAPPLAAAPVDIDALIDSKDAAEPEGAEAKDVSDGVAGYKTKTAGHTKANVSEIVPTTPVVARVDLDTLQLEDAKSIAVDKAVPTMARVNNALPSIDTLFDKREAVDKAVIATEPAAQRPVELPKSEAPKKVETPPAKVVETPAPGTKPEILAAQALAKINHGDLPQNIKDALPKKTNWKNISAMLEFLMTKGELTDSQALGVVANSIIESLGVNPDQHQIGGPAFGIVQWEAGRRTAMEQYATNHGKPVDDLDIQLEYLLLELKRDAWYGYAELKQAKTVREAMLIFMNKFERPGVPHEDRRILVANIITDIFNDKLHVNQPAAEAAPDTQLAVAKYEREAGNPKWHLPVPEGSPQSDQYPGHKGIDYAVNTGTPFFASIGGTVKVLTYDVSDAGFCKAAMANIGTTMAAVKDPIQHEVRITTKIGDDTYEVIYAHMSQIDVKDGQVVEGGQQIGLTGGSGCSTGPHAHFEIRKNGKAISPTEVLNGVDVRTLSGNVVVVAKGAADSVEYEDAQHDHMHVEEEITYSVDEELLARLSLMKQLAAIKSGVK